MFPLTQQKRVMARDHLQLCFLLLAWDSDSLDCQDTFFLKKIWYEGSYKNSNTFHNTFWNRDSMQFIEKVLLTVPLSLKFWLKVREH